jgi:3-isopropylmalate dehydrogenase
MIDIAVVAGDGIGPEVVAEAVKVLKIAAARYGFGLGLHDIELGADRYLRTGELLPDSTLRELRGYDAILFGAVGDPRVKPGILEKDILLKLRFELDLYINLRPAKLYPGAPCPLVGKGPADVDMAIVRENTEGLYVGQGSFERRGEKDEIALQLSRNTRFGVERCVRYAFEYARKNHRQRVTFCGKTNVLNFAHDLWMRVFEAVRAEYAGIEANYAHVDALCMFLVKNPENYDVIVTDNMFGDIVSDLAAIIQGGLGVAAGANLNPAGVSMFEPIHGSAPPFKGQGVVNPIAAINAGRMLLDHLGQTEAAAAIDRAVARTIARDLKGLDVHKMGCSTGAAGDLIAGYVRGE